MSIINIGIPPIVRPITSKTLNMPFTSRMFQSLDSMKDTYFAASTAGKTMKERVIPKNTWNSIGHANLKATREFVHSPVIVEHFD